MHRIHLGDRTIVLRGIFILFRRRGLSSELEHQQKLKRVGVKKRLRQLSDSRLTGTALLGSNRSGIDRKCSHCVDVDLVLQGNTVGANSRRMGSSHECGGRATTRSCVDCSSSAQQGGLRQEGQQMNLQGENGLWPRGLAAAESKQQAARCCGVVVVVRNEWQRSGQRTRDDAPGGKAGDLFLGLVATANLSPACQCQAWGDDPARQSGAAQQEGNEWRRPLLTGRAVLWCGLWRGGRGGEVSDGCARCVL